jgi:PAS domain S-box-containing protein
LSQIIERGNEYRVGRLPISANSQRDPEHWRLEEALKKSEERFRALSDKMDLVALILDAQGNVTFCNQYLLGLIGWREEEILGRNWCDMCVPWEQYPRMLYVSQLANSAIPSRHENEVFDRSGTTRLIDWYNTILYDKAGHPTGVASIGHEITIDVALQTLSQEEREALSRSYLSGQMEEQLPHDLGSDPERLRKLKRRRKELDAAIEVLEKIARARHPELASGSGEKLPN